MRNIIWMREKRQEMLDQADAILRAAASDGRQYITTAERDEQEALVAKAKALEAEIAEEEEFQGKALRGELPTISLDEWAGVSVDTASKLGGPGKTFRSLFGQPSGSPWKSHSEYIGAVFSNRFDPRLDTRQHQTGEDYLGGYACPTTLTEWLFDRSLENEIVRSRAQVWAMPHLTRRIPAFAVGRTDGAYEAEDWSLFGGFRPIWTPELTESEDQTATLRVIELNAKKLAIYCQASAEVIADGLAFETNITDALLKATSFSLDYAFLRGEGGTEPVGVLNVPELVEVPRVGAGAIAYADVVAMYARLAPSCANNAIWIASVETLPELLSMTDESNHLVWSPVANARVPQTLLGLPLIRTEKLPGLGSPGDLLLCDLSHYAIGMRAEAALDRSNAPGWYQDAINWRVLLRCDGRGTWDEPIRPVNGGDTLSWAVALSDAGYES